MKWVSKVTFVDRETGEEIDKRLINTGEYIKLKSSTKTKYDEVTNTRTRFITWQCEKSRQQKLW